jgi:hypothetical protein
MAIGSTTNYGDDVGIARVYEPAFESIVFTQNDLLGASVGGRPLFERRASQGGTHFRKKVRVSGNTSAALYSEGDGAPGAVASIYVNGVWPYAYFWASIRITGHTRDAVKNQGVPQGLNVIDEEMIVAMEFIRDLMNTTFMSDSTYGLELAVDSAGTYGNINRTTYSNWGATETALSGALTRTHLLDQSEFARDNEKGSGFGKNGNGVILMPNNQVTNYIRLSGEPNASNSSVRVELAPSGGAGGGRIDYSPRPDLASHQGVPIIGLADWTDTVIIGLDTRPGKNLFIEHRSFSEGIRPQAPAGDDDVTLLTTAAAIVDLMPRFDWKSTGVTA